MSHEERRVESRIRTAIRIRLRSETEEHEAIVLDASTRGLLAMMPHPPARGEYVELYVAGQWMIGRVRWHGPDRFGVALQERIDVPALIAGNAGPVALAQTPAARPNFGGTLAVIASDSLHMARGLQLLLLTAAIVTGCTWWYTIG